MKPEYGLLRTVSKLFKIVAFLALAVAVIGFLFGIVRLLGSGSGIVRWAQVIGAAIAVYWGFTQFMVLYAIGEGLNVLLDIESHTRATSMELMRQRSESAQ